MLRRWFLVLFVLAFSFGFSEKKIGNWFLSIREDPVTGEVAHLALVFAKESPPEAINGGAFSFYCNDLGQFSVMLDADLYIGSGTADVQYRVSALFPKYDRWDISPKGTALFPPEPWELLKELVLAPAPEIAIRVWDYRGVPYTYVFDMAGLHDLIEQIPCTKGFKERIRKQIIKPSSP